MKFNMEEQYQVYLEKVKLDERRMGKVQRVETRRAFYAGISMAVLHFFSVADMTDNDAFAELDNMMNQVKDYWGLFNINEN